MHNIYIYKYIHTYTRTVRMTDMRLFKKKNDASAHSEKLHSSNLVMRISREKMSDVANLSWIRDSTQFSPSI